MDSILVLWYSPILRHGVASRVRSPIGIDPDGMNADGCIMDIYLLDAYPSDQSRPPDAQTIRLDYDQKYAEAEAWACSGRYLIKMPIIYRRCRRA